MERASDRIIRLFFFGKNILLTWGIIYITFKYIFPETKASSVLFILVILGLGIKLFELGSGIIKSKE